MDGMGMMAWGVLSLLVGLLLIFLFILGVAAAIKWLWKDRSFAASGEGETPLHVLKKRYARGEIGKEEYERVKKDIE